MELAQLVAIEVRLAGAGDEAEELETHIRRVVRVVRTNLLRDPMPPHRQAEPLHNVIRIASPPNRVPVRAAYGLRPLKGFRVVAEEGALGALGEVFEEVGFVRQDLDDGGVQVFVADGGAQGGAVEAPRAVNQGFFPEGFAAQAEGEVEPGGGVAGDGAMEDLAEGEEGGFDGAGYDAGLVAVLKLVVFGVGGARGCNFTYVLKVFGHAEDRAGGL